ncbi:Glutathione import ATP-binding protein GsiA [Halioglobus japonicus]|nr:Glutathione import ATP-binding protein GsiA [Halioglobus japonicus]
MLTVENLGVSFVTRMGTNKAVDGISFTVETGKITAIIGESGSGKSVACYSLLGLVPQPPGRIDSGRALFHGQDLLQLKPQELRKIRGRDIAMVFQDPMTCLNPYMTVGKQLMEPLLYHHKVSTEQARARALELMAEVGLRDPATTIDNYPHQFSGGMRQRIMIAMALINEPQLLIADEPTTALDVTIQAQILKLLASLQKKRDIGILFISHDLAVVADIADQIVVMQEGRIVETGNRDDIFRNAQHPYTRKLLNAIPRGGKPVELPASEPLVTVRNLCTWFRSGKSPVKAVDDVSFDILRGEVLGLVGESGSGKSTIGRSLLRLVPVTSGQVQFDGIDVTALRGRELKNLRRRMQFIFQDPFASLNPRMTVYDTLAEPLLLHGLETRKTVGAHVLQLMDDVGLARAFVRKYPHEFSGGQRQRIAIGRALATRPEFVVADEPVSALDVTIQAQVLELMRELGREYGLTMLFISHDLAVVRQLADRIIVLNKGKVVEQARTEDLFERPQQTYTQQLLQSIPGRALLDIN